MLIANAVALPVSYWLMREWLNQFAFHAQMPWYTFSIAVGVTFAISFVSISVKAFRAAHANPVNSLRSE